MVHNGAQRSSAKSAKSAKSAHRPHLQIHSFKFHFFKFQECSNGKEEGVIPGGSRENPGLPWFRLIWAPNRPEDTLQQRHCRLRLEKKSHFWHNRKPSKKWKTTYNNFCSRQIYPCCNFNWIAFVRLMILREMSSITRASAKLPNAQWEIACVKLVCPPELQGTSQSLRKSKDKTAWSGQGSIKAGKRKIGKRSFGPTSLLSPYLSKVGKWWYDEGSGKPMFLAACNQLSSLVEVRSTFGAASASKVWATFIGYKG